MYTNVEDLSRELAREAHADQTDQQGRSYYDAHLTPIADACALFGPTLEAAGWLHDIIEDTDHTRTTLEAAGVPSRIVDIVEAVTRNDGETYNKFLSRTVQDPSAAVVKYVDNAWNIINNPALALVDPDKADRLLNQRYLPARGRLSETLENVLSAYDVHRIDIVLRNHLRRLS